MTTSVTAEAPKVIVEPLHESAVRDEQGNTKPLRYNLGSIFKDAISSSAGPHSSNDKKILPEILSFCFADVAVSEIVGRGIAERKNDAEVLKTAVDNFIEVAVPAAKRILGTANEVLRRGSGHLQNDTSALEVIGRIGSTLLFLALTPAILRKL